MRKYNCIQLELTNNCNYKCPNCPRNSGQMTRKKGFANINLIKKLLKENYNIARYVNFSFFGEPLLHPDFIDLMEYTKNKPKNFKTVINSNISLLTGEVIDKLIECRLSQLRISIDAVTNDTYDIVRPSNFCLDLNGNKISGNRLDVIDEKIRYWFSLSKHVPTRHVIPVSSLNYHEIDSYVKKWQPLLSDNDEILIKSVLTYGGKIFDSFVFKNKCNIWTQGVATVDWQGNVTPCNLDTNMDLIIGNIRKESLMKIWNSEKYDEMKKKSEARVIYPCNKCIDSNNWTRNITIRKNDVWDEEKFKKVYSIN